MHVGEGMFFVLTYNIVLVVSDSELISDCIKIFKIKKSHSLNEKKTIYAHQNSKDNQVILVNDNLHITTKRKLWIANLLYYLNNIINKLYQNHVIFHGSCVSFKNQNILFVGRSNSGKSTAVYTLNKKHQAPIISDDITIYDHINNRMIMSDIILIQLRSLHPQQAIKIRNAWDTEDVYLCTIDNTHLITQNKGIDEIILIKFDYSIDNYLIKRLTLKESVDTVLKNSFNISNLKMSSIIDLCNKINFYQLTYGKSNQLGDIINQEIIR